MNSESGFEEIEHTADWALRVWAADLPALLAEAAAGMYRLMGAVPGKPSGEVRIRAVGIDPETLLVDFLSEILHLGENNGLMIVPVPPVIDGFRATFSAHCMSIAAQEKEIKAVTYHDLAVREKQNGLETVIVFDV